MRILIFGGTRFIGAELVARHVLAGHSVTIVSRREYKLPGVHSIVCEKMDFASKHSSFINDNFFDVIYDFIVYSIDSVINFSSFNYTRCIMISTVWVAALWGATDSSAYQEITTSQPLGMLPVALKYAHAKYYAESLFLETNKDKSIVLRLPITLGPSDHTARYSYLQSRVHSNLPILTIDNDDYKLQVLHIDDLVDSIFEFSKLFHHNLPNIIEALPPMSTSMKELWTKLITNNNPAKPNPIFFNIPSEYYINSNYSNLSPHPFWHSPYIPPSPNNLFMILGSFTSDFSLHKLEPPVDTLNCSQLEELTSYGF